MKTCLLLSASFVLVACGGGGDKAALLLSADGKYRVVFQGDGQWNEQLGRKEMESALARFPKIDLVYAHNDPMAHGARLAADQQHRPGIRFVGVDALADEGRKYVTDGLLDTTVEYPTLGAEAIDLALLACNGVQLPRELTVGTRVWTAANSNGGGAAVPAPGDFQLKALRHQYEAVLTTSPKTDNFFKIGMAQCNDAEPWRVAMRTDMQAAAKRYPQVQFSYRDAGNDNDKQRAIVADFVAQGFHAIVVSPKESLVLAAACKEALAKNVKVIVLDRRLGTDDFTCFLGGDNVAIGKAVGDEILRLLPEGGTIVEIQGLMTSTPAQERHQGFVQRLGLVPPK